MYVFVYVCVCVYDSNLKSTNDSERQQGWASGKHWGKEREVRDAVIIL